MLVFGGVTPWEMEPQLFWKGWLGKVLDYVQRRVQNPANQVGWEYTIQFV